MGRRYRSAGPTPPDLPRLRRGSRLYDRPDDAAWELPARHRLSAALRFSTALIRVPAVGSRWRSRRRPPPASPRPARSGVRLGGRTDVRQRQLSATHRSGRPSVRLRCPQLGWFGGREPRSCCDKPTNDDCGWDRDRNPDAQENRQSPCHIGLPFLGRSKAPVPSRGPRKHRAREQSDKTAGHTSILRPSAARRFSTARTHS